MHKTLNTSRPPLRELVLQKENWILFSFWFVSCSINTKTQCFVHKFDVRHLNNTKVCDTCSSVKCCKQQKLFYFYSSRNKKFPSAAVSSQTSPDSTSCFRPVLRYCVCVSWCCRTKTQHLDRFYLKGWMSSDWLSAGSYVPLVVFSLFCCHTTIIRTSLLLFLVEETNWKWNTKSCRSYHYIKKRQFRPSWFLLWCL